MPLILIIFPTNNAVFSEITSDKKHEEFSRNIVVVQVEGHKVLSWPTSHVHIT